MRHSTTFLMSLIVASILVLMFLNLVLGSVSIPLKSVWNIICGLGDEPVTWQNIVWKSRLPQALTALVAGAGLAISGLQMQTVSGIHWRDLPCWGSAPVRAWAWPSWCC